MATLELLICLLSISKTFARITMTADKMYVPVGGNVYISCRSDVKMRTLVILNREVALSQCSILACQLEDPNSSATVPVRDNTNAMYDEVRFEIKNFNHNNAGSYTCMDGNDRNVKDSVDINYSAAIVSVELTPNVDPMNLVAGESSTFSCVTSESRPAATVSWFKGSENITSFSTSVTNNFITVSNLTYTPSRDDQSERIWCEGSNGGTTVVSSTKLLANIQFGPSIPDCDYAGADAPLNITVREGASVSLECTSNGNPTPSLTWTHPGPGQNSQLTLSNIQKIHTGTFTVTSRNTLSPYGQTDIPKSNSISYIVQVMYPPESIQCTVGSASSLESGTLRVVKGSKFTITCVADGFPASTWTWSWSGGNVSNNQLSVPNIQTEGPFTVIARNTMTLTNGSTETGRTQNEYSLQLLFFPTTPEFHYGINSGSVITGNLLSVIRGNTIAVTCVSTGNPEPRYSSWNKTGQLRTFTATSDTTGTCVVSSTLDPTGYDNQFRSLSGTLYIKVLYPPEDPVLYYRGCFNKTIEVTVVKVLETHHVHVTCGANGNPAPAYKWSNYQSGEDIFFINGARRSQKGTYSCLAENNMDTTFEDPVSGRSSKNFTLDILYPPEIAALETITVLEGNNSSSTCHVSPGFPMETNFKWTRNNETIAISTSETLRFINISRTQAGIYKCTAWNAMQPTGCDVVNGTSSQELIIDVQYKAAITDFQVANSDGEKVILNEDVPVSLHCEVDSNPGAKIVLWKAGQPIKEVSNAQSIYYVKNSSQCEDDGTYSCTGSNILNKVSDKKTLELYVKCSPRVSTQSSPILTVTAGTSSSATLTYDFVAYPRPSASDVTWEKHSLETSDWTELHNTSDVAITLSRNNLQTNITVMGVEQSDFGQYRVNVSNELGSITENFLLKAEEVPSAPRNLQSLDKMTDSSVIITWIPGFDGGLPQTFIIQFSETSKVTWREEDVEPGHINHTIYNLKPGTTYEVQVIARNSLGNSSASDVILVTTLASIEKEQPRLGQIIGGAVGGLTGIGLIALVLLVVLKLWRKAQTKEDACNLTKDHKMHSMSSSRSIKDDEDDEVINPIYEGGGDDQNIPTDAIYSKPMRKKHDQVGDVYAVVDKQRKPKATTSKNKTSKINVNDEKPGNQNRTKGGNVNNGYNTYENHDVSTEKDKFQKNVNQDGLVYADLEFPNPPKGQKRLFIHGLDDMTEYADVDLTKRADPLPDSEDEEKGEP